MPAPDALLLSLSMVFIVFGLMELRSSLKIVPDVRLLWRSVGSKRVFSENRPPYTFMYLGRVANLYKNCLRDGLACPFRREFRDSLKKEKSNSVRIAYRGEGYILDISLPFSGRESPKQEGFAKTVR